MNALTNNIRRLQYEIKKLIDENKALRIYKSVTQLRKKERFISRPTSGPKLKPYSKFTPSGKSKRKSRLELTFENEGLTEEEAIDLFKRVSCNVMKLDPLSTIELLISNMNLTVRQQRALRSYLHAMKRNIFSSEKKCRNFLKRLTESFKLTTETGFQRQEWGDIELDVVTATNVKKVVYQSCRGNSSSWDA